MSLNAQLLIRAGFIDKLMAGVYTYLPLGLRVFKKIENIIREEMIVAGGQEILMPSLQPKENWEKTGRWDTVDSLFRFTSHYSKIDFALGPTHEEVISPLVKNSICLIRICRLVFSSFKINSEMKKEPSPAFCAPGSS